MYVLTYMYICTCIYTYVCNRYVYMYTCCSMNMYTCCSKEGIPWFWQVAKRISSNKTAIF